jgi:NADPH:quinone reductase-like Zn-dependent oxidoreductase
MSSTPATQYAVQLVGPSDLKLNTSKEVFKPGPHQVLCKIEAVGLCFSDLKLLKQFTDHPRKGEIVKGLDVDAFSRERMDLTLKELTEEQDGVRHLLA